MVVGGILLGRAGAGVLSTGGKGLFMGSGGIFDGDLGDAGVSDYIL